VAADGVEESVDDADADAAPSLAHVGHGAPLVGVRIVALHAAKAGGAVPTAQGVQLRGGRKIRKKKGEKEKEKGGR
jgi:hypothetical protein